MRLGQLETVNGTRRNVVFLHSDSFPFLGHTCREKALPSKLNLVSPLVAPTPLIKDQDPSDLPNVGPVLHSYQWKCDSDSDAPCVVQGRLQWLPRQGLLLERESMGRAV